jgi:hypothetical protein
MGEIKSVGILRRRQGLSREALFERWQTEHAPFVAENGKPARYRITLFGEQADGSEPAYDGLAEMWWRDEQHYDSWFGDHAPRGVDGFSDVLEPGAGGALKASEHVIVDGAVTAQSEKVVYFVKRREDVPPDDFFAHWRELHAPNVGAAVERTEGCERYAITHGDRGVDGAYDGLAEIWWSNGEAREAGLQGVEDDGFGALIETARTVVIVGREQVIVG